MSKPTSKTTHRVKPFFEDKLFRLSTLQAQHKITGFEVYNKKKHEIKKFLVKGKQKNAITKAWQATEVYLTKLINKA